MAVCPAPGCALQLGVHHRWEQDQQAIEVWTEALELALGMNAGPEAYGLPEMMNW